MYPSSKKIVHSKKEQFLLGYLKKGSHNSIIYYTSVSYIKHTYEELIEPNVDLNNI